MNVIAPKKLIEVALPLDAINHESARSKRKAPAGYPTTLHCWFAQRPIAAARAVIFAQLVNDPSWKYTDEELSRPQVKSAITRRRNELFQLIAELLPWSEVANETILRRAHAEIAASWRETCHANRAHPDARRLFDPQAIPAVCDPFAGGGSIPLETQRLGLVARAYDLNPVAVLINKALIEFPPKFASGRPVGPMSQGERQGKATATEKWSGAKGLAEDTRRYGAWMRDEAEKRIGHLYPSVKITKAMVKTRRDLSLYEGRELTVVAWLWARTVKSPNPAFARVDVPLASTFLLSSKPGKEAYVEPVLEANEYRFEVKVGKPKDLAVTKAGTSAGKWNAFRCLMSNGPVTYDYIRAEGTAGRMGSRLMAVVAKGSNGRVYLSPTPSLEASALDARPSWGPDLEINYHPRDIKTQIYGLTRYRDLFTARQLVALTTLSDLVQEARERVRQDACAAGMPDDGRGLEAGGSGASAYADAIAVYLAFAVDRVADYGSTISTWRPKDSAMRSTLSKQAIPMTWDFAEGSPLGASSSSFEKCVDVVARTLDFLPANAPRATASQAAAQNAAHAVGCFVSTDPPYYDNIGYADLSDFFYVWLRRTLKTTFPSLFATISVPKGDELVATPYRHDGKENAELFFLEGMTRALQQLATHAHPAAPITIYYAFKQSETDSDRTGSTGWETFLEAVLRAGLAVTGTWPVRTEGDNRQIGNDANALASSIVLVTRARSSDAVQLGRKDFVRELGRVLPTAIGEMIADPIASIAPVDLAQACIGPGMALFSKHAAVLEADGSAMTVHDALVHINKAIDEYFSQAEGELDADSRFCIGWFEQHGFEPGEFGQADVLARAKGTSVDGVNDAGVLEAGKGKVRLLAIKELPKKWDPTTDTRAPVWEALHHMCKALGESEAEAGALLAKMPAKQDAIRQLAYRLYTLCAERKKQPELGRPYNELITSWPAIVEAASKVGYTGAQLDLV